MTRPLVVVATLPEAWPLRGLGVWVAGMARRNYRLPSGRPVIGAGFAGACRPEVISGDLVVSGTEAPRVGQQLRLRLAREHPRDTGLLSAAGATIHSGDIQTLSAIASPARKRELGRAGAQAVDMETAWLQRAAATQGLPFLSLRVIIDGVDDRALGWHTTWRYPAAARRLRWAVFSALEVWP